MFTNRLINRVLSSVAAAFLLGGVPAAALAYVPVELPVTISKPVVLKLPAIA